MTKNDLIKQVHQAIPLFPQKDMTYAVNAIFAAMADALKNNERIEIRGWGSFTVKLRRARNGRNPKDGEVFSLPPRNVTLFKVSKELQRIINGLS